MPPARADVLPRPAGKKPQPPSGAPRAAQPANDDRPGVGAVLSSMHRRPSKSPFWAALFVSVLWIAGIIAYTSLVYIPATPGLSGVADLASTPALPILAASAVLPVLLFFALATLVWRTQDLRLLASSLTEATVRLVEPEKIATDGVASVGGVS